MAQNKIEEIKDFLEEKVETYNTSQFIETDPISIPHQFSKKEDIEIAGFLSATIAWGNRKMIIRNAQRMVELMDMDPFNFVMNASESDFEVFKGFVHRTFNSDDFQFFIKGLRNLYLQHDGMEAVFENFQESNSMQRAISKFKQCFFSIPHPARTTKHVSDPMKGSSAKRINMMLRWFCRQDNKGVDFGIWKSISPAKLSCPLDVHSGNVARKLGLLQRKQNDAKALQELDICLRQLDPEDPVKYDFALFGLGVFEQF